MSVIITWKAQTSRLPLTFLEEFPSLLRIQDFIGQASFQTFGEERGVRFVQRESSLSGSLHFHKKQKPRFGLILKKDFLIVKLSI